MERGFIGSLVRTGDGPVKKKRSKISRWPRCESVNRDESSGCGTVSQKKEYNLNQYALDSPANSEMADTAYKRIRNDDKDFADSDGVDEDGRFKDIDEIVRKDALKLKGNLDLQMQKVDADMDSGKNYRSRSSDYSNGSGSQNNIRKVKLKVGGVTRTIHTNSTSDGASAGGMKPVSSSSAPQARQKLTLQDTPDSCRLLKSVNGLQGVPWKDFSEGNFGFRKESSKEKMPRDRSSEKKLDKSEPSRKSRRTPKRRALDEAFDDEDDDDEIRYLEKIRNLKVNADSGTKNDDSEEGSKHQQNRVSKRRPDHQSLEDVGVSSLGRDGKRSRSERAYEDADYREEEEPSSDGLLDSRSKIQKEFVDSPVEANKETSLTRRQRALQSGKDASTNLVEFPDGLPPAPSRKHKFSEVEQQARKAEAAQRRRMQVEKQARESEAEAIRKILGQDSSRKKREDKLKKRRDELAQEKAANALTLPPNTVRCVIGPTGTVVTFSEDVGLPSILTSKPCSYPPPREKCAGPLCTNPYIYRDSKSKLPLCSLKCYKAIHEQTNT